MSAVSSLSTCFATSPAGFDRLVSAAILDGKALAERLLARITVDVAELRARHGVVPGLAVVRVGDDLASAVYVRNKAKRTRAAGMKSVEHELPASTSEADLLALVGRLNADPTIDGILVQLPLPAAIDAARVIEAIDPAKDVDGFHPLNAGRLANGRPGLVACTPRGCMMLIGSHRAAIAGLEAVVIGRSTIVGKPVAQLLLAADCTVTLAHSKSRDLPEIARRADILVAAVGRAGMVRGDWLKPGAIVINVGINRTTDGRLVGDVAFEEARARAGAITPVPGGVGPMTIACLLDNTLIALRRRRHHE
jgi:methylenetetrahydrofolate dehydrogenase (NADP+) / methenyltetrahydrofolate cyclohydrolase